MINGFESAPLNQCLIVRPDLPCSPLGSPSLPWKVGSSNVGEPPVLKPNGGKVPALATFDAYTEDAGLAPKTRSSWRSNIRDLIVFVGHDDLARLPRKEVLAWKDELQTEIIPERKKKPKAKSDTADKPAEPRTRSQDDPERLSRRAPGDAELRGEPRGSDDQRRKGASWSR